MNNTDVTATLERLYREGQRVIADLAEFANQANNRDDDALLQHLREQSERFFGDMRRQLQDQSQPWVAMLRAWAQLSDGSSPAELLMTPMNWWRPLDREAAASGVGSSGRTRRVETVAAELADARDAYLELLQQAADRAVEQLAATLSAVHNEQLDAHQLYQHWLEAAESAYEETLESEAFAAATGRLTNAWSELLLVMQDNLDGLLGSAGLPTRRELTETQAQIHELRQQQRARERQLRADLEALQERVTGLTAAPAKPRSRPKSTDPS